MSTQSLYEEAIADARKIKEVAEENAKKAILETVTPRIREFIEQQLLEQNDEIAETEEELHEGTDVEAEEEVTLDESAIASSYNDFVLINLTLLLSEINYYDRFEKTYQNNYSSSI